MRSAAILTIKFSHIWIISFWTTLQLIPFVENNLIVNNYSLAEVLTLVIFYYVSFSFMFDQVLYD